MAHSFSLSWSKPTRDSRGILRHKLLIEDGFVLLQENDDVLYLE